jgi:hypothetical protein
MRVYIRNTANQLFYSGWDNWSFDFRRALSFETIPSAEHVIADEHLNSVEIVLIEPDLNVQLSFPGAQITRHTPLDADEPEP